MGRCLPLAWMVSNLGIGNHRPAPHLASAWALVMRLPANPLSRSLWHSARRKWAASSVGRHLSSAWNAAGAVASRFSTDTGSMRGISRSTPVRSSIPRLLKPVMYLIGRLVSGQFRRTVATAKNATCIFAATMATEPFCWRRRWEDRGSSLSARATTAL